MAAPILLASRMLLAIDTCGPLGGVGLGQLHSEGGVKTLATAELMGGTYSSLLISSIEDLLRQASVALKELAAVVVVHGPGSFTGVRVGVSAAKGLAEGLEIPVIALSRLDLLARNSVVSRQLVNLKGAGFSPYKDHAESSRALAPEGLYFEADPLRVSAIASACAALDAGRGEFYFGLYRERMRVVEALYTREDVVTAVTESGLPLVVCESAIRDRLTESGIDIALVAAPTAADALTAGAERFQSGDFADVAALDGNYLRRSYAEDGAPQPAAL